MSSKDSRLLATLRLLTVASGLLLIPLAYLATLSGVCIRLPGAVRGMTGGLLEGYAECHRLHLELIPGVLAPLLVLHVVASLELAFAGERHAGLPLRLVFWAVRLVSWVLGGILLASIVLYYA